MRFIGVRGVGQVCPVRAASGGSRGADTVGGSPPCAFSLCVRLCERPARGLIGCGRHWASRPRRGEDARIRTCSCHPTSFSKVPVEVIGSGVADVRQVAIAVCRRQCGRIDCGTHAVMRVPHGRGVPRQATAQHDPRAVLGLPSRDGDRRPRGRLDAGADERIRQRVRGNREVPSEPAPEAVPDPTLGRSGWSGRRHRGGLAPGLGVAPVKGGDVRLVGLPVTGQRRQLGCP